MESAARKPGRRGRKRRKEDVDENSCMGEETITILKRPVCEKPKALLGQYVKKEFAGNGFFLGKVMSYAIGLYRIRYEDGDYEDLETSELREVLVDSSGLDDVWMARKTKFDVLLPDRNAKKRSTEDVGDMSSRNRISRRRGVPKVVTADVPEDKLVMVEGSSAREVSSGLDQENNVDLVDYEADSCSDSCEHAKDLSLQVETSLPPVLFPPSSGDIGVPEEHVSHVLSVYSFLRSFSTRIFLSPFSLDDFVGSVNCSVRNTLMDSICFALMRALKRHLEMLSLDGSLMSLKCLRCLDWSLLDALTWPVYLVNYFMVMGYVKGPEWKGFSTNVLEREFYTLPIRMKLMILQILCDDILDSAELKAELDMREVSEVGGDSDAALTNYVDTGPRKVHPRISTSSARNVQEVVTTIPNKQNTVSVCSSNSIKVTGSELSVATDTEVDGNVDDCRLCGMDGTLLCCDGCPSAYHSRCIGINKLYIPEGSWFCPECTINKAGPIITKETALRGAKVFGVDCYEQVFLGTCNHLLVLKVSLEMGSCIRYYSSKDISKILHSLCSSVDYATIYLEMCQKIACYWNIQDDTFFVRGTVETSSTLPCSKMEEEGKVSLNSGCQIVIEMPGNSDSSATCVAATLIPSSTTCSTLNLEDGRHIDSDNLKTMKSESAISLSQKSNPPNVMEAATCASGNSTQSRSDLTNVNAMPPPAAIPFQSSERNHGSGGDTEFDFVKEDLYLGSSFRTNGYINYYIHGDFAASAAASLAVISSEENHISDPYASDSRKKLLSANISIQTKAFSSAASRFFWPNTEKKVVEVPRERCGWCLSCKAPPTSKRACLLNSAALNATRGIMKAVSSLRSIRNVEGYIASIAIYMLYMEESLCGFLLGPFLHANFRKWWRQSVEQASSFRELKGPLLKLEENINLLALSTDWLKLVDLWLIGPVNHTTTSVPGPIQKRGPGRRRKHFDTPEVTAECSYEKPADFSWWRGEKVSKCVFQKATLPNSLLKKAARIGGTKKITGLCYVESLDISKRSWQTVWRAAVEMSRTASQLALQVRYLDNHIKWGDLTRPEQNIMDNRGAETEAFAFRNAHICGKRVVESNVQYEVAFGNQKHLPSCVLKNIVSTEPGQDGKDKYWFLETHIPLYLIKEYEENMNISAPPKEKRQNLLSYMKKVHMKASRRCIFQYLVCKRDKEEKCACVSCKEDIFLREAVKCSYCEGYFHASCTISSHLGRNREFESRICRQCCITVGLIEAKNSEKSPISPLPPQEQLHDTVESVPKIRKLKFINSGVQKNSETKSPVTNSCSAAKNTRRICSWGIIWKKKKIDEDMSSEFRIKNIILKGNPGMNLVEPVCHLCHQPYNSDLMYICCENCCNWAHADALEINESKIPNMLGYKCCKCRRIKSPDCPYADAQTKRQSSKRTSKLSKQTTGQQNFDQGPKNGAHPPHVVIYGNEMFVDNESFSDPFSRTEEFMQQPLTPAEMGGVDSVPTEVENNGFYTVPVPKKLPIRRYAKQTEENFDYDSQLNASVVPQHQDGVRSEYAEYEPQTYFSLTELLSADDDVFDDRIVMDGREQKWATTSDPLMDGDILCAICSRAEPDFSCSVCGICIHSYCSPWVEDGSYPEGGWRCGHCREWR